MDGRTLRLAVTVWACVATMGYCRLPIKKNLFSSAEDFIELLSGLMSGPLSGHGLVLYLDQSQVPIVTTLSHTPCVMVDLAANGSSWCREQPAAVTRGAYLVHAVVFHLDPRPFFEDVSQKWNPKLLLLLNMSSKNYQKLLKAKVFSGPENIVLFQRQFQRNKVNNGGIEAFTYFPFAKKEQVRSLGSYRSNGLPFEAEIIPDRFPSFEGYMFWLGTWFDDYPYLHQSKTGAEGEGDGVEVEMLDALADAFDFKYNLTTEPPDLNWGDYENGSWTGMLGMVHSGDKNFTVNYFGYTNERIEAFDASVSYWNEGFGLALLTPPPLPKWRSVYYPFMPFVWASVVATFFLGVIIMYFQDRVQMEPLLGGVHATWSYLLRPVVSRSLPRLPRAQWQRVFVATWCLAAFILTTAYTANLIAFLTIPVFPRRIQTVQQLAESNYRVAMYDYGEFVPGALRSSRDPYYRSLGQRLDLFATDDESMHPFQQGTHAYLESYSYSLVYIFDRYQVRNAYMLLEQLYPGHLCWYFAKNTAWKYKFDQGIQRLVEAGLIAHWLEVKTADFLGWDYKDRLEHRGRDRSPSTPLALEHLQGAFYLLLLGLALSGLVFLLEVVTRASSKAYP